MGSVAAVTSSKTVARIYTPFGAAEQNMIAYCKHAVENYGNQAMVGCSVGRVGDSGG